MEYGIATATMAPRAIHFIFVEVRRRMPAIGLSPEQSWQLNYDYTTLINAMEIY